MSLLDPNRPPSLPGVRKQCCGTRKLLMTGTSPRNADSAGTMHGLGGHRSKDAETASDQPKAGNEPKPTQTKQNAQKLQAYGPTLVDPVAQMLPYIRHTRHLPATEPKYAKQLKVQGTQSIAAAKR
jgi:hypothetical protein